jgi:hypothetical protein
VGQDLGRGEVARRIADELVLVGEGEVDHRSGMLPGHCPGRASMAAGRPLHSGHGCCRDPRSPPDPRPRALLPA